MWIFTSRIFRLALDITFFHQQQVFFPAYGLPGGGGVLIKAKRLENLL